MKTQNIVVLLIVIIILVALVSWYFSKEKKLTGQEDASKQKTITSSSIKTGVQPSFAFSIWVYVGDWSMYSGSEKVIYTVGDDNLKLSLGAISPTLMIYTQNSSGNEVFEVINITNIPLQSWVCLAVSVNGLSMDVYINGKLTKTAISQENVYFSNNTVVLSPGSTDGEAGIGFGGYTNRFKYWSSALTPNEAWNIYKKGPGGSLLGNLIGDRGIKINLMNGTEVTSTFTL